MNRWCEFFRSVGAGSTAGASFGVGIGAIHDQLTNTCNAGIILGFWIGLGVGTLGGLAWEYSQRPIDPINRPISQYYPPAEYSGPV